MNFEPEKLAAPIRVIDSHTAGEPTRIVVSGAPSLGDGPMVQRLHSLGERFDWLRTALVTEPRGAEWMVGALLQTPVDPQCVAGILFFNNDGYLGMCGHGMLGAVATLAYLGRIGPGLHRCETPVGEVAFKLSADGTATVENVASYRLRKDVSVTLDDGSRVIGDVAWGGNWFFLTGIDQTPKLDRLDHWLALARQIRRRLVSQGITGADGAQIDHIELVGPPEGVPHALPRADTRSFVLCPGGHYDRSPCGTGSSAKVACLAADRLLAPGDVYRQESVTGGIFALTYRVADGKIYPSVTGRAHVNADLQLVFNSEDPFQWGIGSRRRQ